MKAAFVVLALCALFAVAKAEEVQTTAAPAVAEATRFAETESEDQAVLAEQEEMFEDALDLDEAEDEAEEESEEDLEDEADADEEVEEETEDETEDEEEGSDEEAEETDAEAEESEEEAETESEEEDTEAEEDEGESDEFVLAELQDNPKFTGFMQMTAEFVPTEAAEADHLVHSLSSHQQAAAYQQYTFGYAHGQADAAAATAPAPHASEEEEGEEEAEEGEEAEVSFVEASGAPVPVYGFPGQFPSGIDGSHGTHYYGQASPYYSYAPPPPPMPTYLPPPPYVPPVPAAGADAKE